MKTSEVQLCKAIAQSIKIWENQNPDNKLIWFHIPNEGARSIYYGKMLKQMGLRAGTPDYVFITPNKTFFVEVKTNKGCLTRSQKEFMMECKNKGIEYFILKAKDVEDAFIKIKTLIGGIIC